ncbi:MAG: peptidoglycan DD-metalloendopeptidase family protein [candidate division Zixibacteria bacterium]
MWRIIFVALFSLLAIHTSSRARDKDDIVGQRKDLNRIKQDVDRSEKRLDSLQSAEKKILSELSNHGQRVSSDRKVIGRLGRELAGLKKGVKQAEDELSSNEELLDRVRRRYLGSVRQTYLAVRWGDELQPDDPNSEMKLQRQVTYLTRLAEFESKNVEQAQVFLASSVDDLDEVTGQRKEVSRLKRKRERNLTIGQSRIETEERKLGQVKRASQDEADLMLTLRQAAQEMETIIAELEHQQSLQEARSAPGESVFAAMKGHLLRPVSGKIITAFGASQHKVTKLKSFSPGIVIKTRPSSSVSTAAAGTVSYRGSLRGYGNFVIISHDSQYFTTYAGLGKVDVSQGQYLRAGSKLGTAAADGQVRFELRRGREPLDPVKWIKFEDL